MKIKAFFLLVLFACTAYSQTDVREKLPQFSQDPKATYRLFPTTNTYNYILLDTRYGIMKLVQWNVDKEHRFIYTLNSDTLANNNDSTAVPGRFTLYATTNIYNFLLLDTKEGYVWQVQWSTDATNRKVMRIYTEGELFYRSLFGIDEN